jgi:hypothetical protein
MGDFSWPSEVALVPDTQVKGQWVRLADVVFVGPLMVYFGVQARDVSPWLRGAMVALGAATVIFNGRNYLMVQQAAQQAAQQAQEILRK